MQAFPVARTYTNRDGEVASEIEDGMTLRDYFAAKAMQTFLSNANGLQKLSEQTGTPHADLAATAAYECANAMLRARDNEG